MNRKTFLKLSALLSSSLFLGCDLSSFKKQNFKLSLSQWSLHKTIFGGTKEKDYHQWKKWLNESPEKVLQGSLHPLDFPFVAKNTYGFNAVDYVNTFFFRENEDYFTELKKRCKDNDVESVLIMIDEEGMLADLDTINRKKAIENHRKWLYKAAILGCHSIRVNLHGTGTKEEQQENSIESLTQLCDEAKTLNLDVIIENHGGMSSEPNWLLEIIKKTEKSNLGTMVDFDNFKYSETKIWDGEYTYDRYKGVELLLPYAKSVSAKSYSFNNLGDEETIDYKRMAEIIKKSDFKNHISVEFEGEGENSISEKEGILATKNLLEKYL